MPDVQDGYGLMISELLGNNSPSCSVPTDLNYLHNHMGLQNAEVTYVITDRLFFSLWSNEWFWLPMTLSASVCINTGQPTIVVGNFCTWLWGLFYCRTLLSLIPCVCMTLISHAYFISKFLVSNRQCLILLFILNDLSFYVFVAGYSCWRRLNIYVPGRNTWK